jgi:hypothetical protein
VKPHLSFRKRMAFRKEDGGWLKFPPDEAQFAHVP